MIYFSIFSFFLSATFIQLNNVVANDWQIIDFFMLVAQNIDDMSIDLGKSLFDKRE
jgi:hypothetical protein